MSELREFCFKHQVLRPAGEQCARCESEASAAERRDAINMHEARITDLETRLLRTNRIVVELVKRIQRDQQAHNALARHSEQLLTRAERILAQFEREHATVYTADCSCGFHEESHTPMAYSCCPSCGASVVT